MEDRQYTILAETEDAAQERAIIRAGVEGFDALRIVRTVCNGVVESSPDRTVYRWRVLLRGNHLSELESRYLWGDR